MAIWSLSLLFASVAFGHTGIKRILIDGTSYHPFDGRIDHLVGPVKRIEWTRDIISGPFQPITNFSDASLACRENGRPPQLKAVARAGAKVSTFWTEITRMHEGPALAYLAPLPDWNTPATQLKFFKIFEQGFDPVEDKFANQIASDMGDSFSFQLPSDIKAGTYVLRTELIALHGNMKEQKSTVLKGQVQIYPHCFNIEIIGSGSATPEGVVFPGAYKLEDPSFTFAPFLTYGNSTEAATEVNSKFVPPGPPKYNGKYDAPTGPRPVVTETGAYPPALEYTYQDLIRKIERPALGIATYINTAWPHYKVDAKVMSRFAEIGVKSIADGLQVMNSIKADIEAFKKATH